MKQIYEEHRQAIFGTALVVLMVAGFLMFSGSFNIGMVVPDTCEWETLEVEGDTFDTLDEFEQSVQDNTDYDTIGEYAEAAEESADREIDFRQGAEGVEVIAEC